MDNRTDGSNGRELGAYSKRKVERILAAARQLFTGQGFGATSMDAVAALAEVSKATVYAHFKSKDELFAAVIANEAQTPTMALRARQGEAPDTVLERFGFEAFDLILSPTNVAWIRTVAAEAIRFPDLGRVFFQSGPAALTDRLGEYLTQAMDRGELRRAPPRQVAAQFFGMILGDANLRALLGVAGTISRRERSALVKGGVEAFLRAYRID